MAVRVDIARLTILRVHRIPRPTLVTIAKRPSCGRGTARDKHDFPKNRREIFAGQTLESERLEYAREIRFFVKGVSCLWRCTVGLQNELIRLSQAHQQSAGPIVRVG